MEISKVEYLKKHYAFDEWRNRNTLDDNLFVWKFFPSENELAGWQPRRVQRVELPEVEKSDGPTFIQSIWQGAEDETETLLRVDSFECRSLEDAHEYLLQTLGEFQSPLLKRTEEIAGDVAFTFPGETTALFARANLVILLRNAGRKVQPVTQLAAKFDETLISKPEREEDGIRKQELNFFDKDLKTGETMSLGADLFETEVEGQWYKFFSSSGEVLLENGNPVYTSKMTGLNKVEVFIIQPKRIRGEGRMF
ncbi:MAG TPA: hypothetical protein VK892_11780 [Pyrinomonadaceae bacterium]|nr:hypothetical protein [Pyrinomonadaceae bacterium]